MAQAVKERGAAQPEVQAAQAAMAEQAALMAAVRVAQEKEPVLLVAMERLELFGLHLQDPTPEPIQFKG
jgi:hypothetical protein